MQMKQSRALAILMGLLAASSFVGMARADMVDDFDGTALNPAWTVTLGGDNAAAWTHSVTGGELVVTDIVDSTYQSGSAYVTMTRPIWAPLSGDFEATLDFEWDSGSIAPMDKLKFALLDAEGNELAYVLYRDSWISHRAAKDLYVAGVGSTSTGKDTVPLSGNTTFSIRRTNGYLTADWGDGSTVLTAPGINGTSVATALVEFGHCRWGTNSFPGFNVDRVAAVADPSYPLVLSEPFDGTTLDPAWDVSIGGGEATSWSHSLTDGKLVVTDVNDVTLNDGQSGIVTLTQDFLPVTNFTAQMRFSYGSEGGDTAMQKLLLYLQDESGNDVAVVGLNDGWIGYAGQQYAKIGGLSYASGRDSLPADSNGFIDLLISRHGEQVTIQWNGDTILTGTSADVLSRARLEFQYYAYPNSIFGTGTVDFLTISGVPEPATLTVLCGGLLGMALRRRRQRR